MFTTIKEYLTCASTYTIPTDQEMLVGNIDGLVGKILCEFLQKMDDEERRMQSLSSLPYNNCKTEEEKKEYKLQEQEKILYFVDLATSSVFGAVGYGCCRGKKYLPFPLKLAVAAIPAGFAHGCVQHLKAICRKGIGTDKIRLERLMIKVNEISKKMINLDATADLDQLKIAENFINKKIQHYSQLQERIPDFAGKIRVHPGARIHISFNSSMNSPWDSSDFDDSPWNSPYSFMNFKGGHIYRYQYQW